MSPGPPQTGGGEKGQPEVAAGREATASGWTPEPFCFLETHYAICLHLCKKSGSVVLAVG